MFSNDPEQLDFEYDGIPVSFLLPSREDHISRILMSTRTFYEESMLKAIAPRLGEGDLVIDAGANIGNHTLFFAKVLKCRVMAFEPIPATAAVLAENVERNGLGSQVQVCQFALGEADGTARIAASYPGNIGGTTLEASPAGEVPIRALDSIDRPAPVRFIKVDVEGMDLEVLKGARRILMEERPWVACEAGTPQSFGAIREFMAEVGYMATAVFNATDTFLFLPASTKNERDELLLRGFEQMMGMQRYERELAGRIAQAGRYNERLKREALAEVNKRLGAWGYGPADLHPAQGPTPYSQQLESIMRLLEARNSELDEARAALLEERELAAQQLTDARTTGKAYSLEVATLREHVVQLQRLLDERTAELEWHRHAYADLQAKLEKANGLLARKARDYDDKIRRLTDAHRVLRLKTGEAARLDIQLAALQREMQQVRDSISFKLGALLVQSARSPARLLAIVWTVPRLLWKEWRGRHG